MADDGMPSSSGQANKRRRIQMGPQECLEYSNTPQGAASLTNPQSQMSKICQASTSSSGQRGRTNGSCFIPGTRTESSGRNPSTATAKHRRQYVSPSKGANAQPSQQNVYNSSGYALIGSPKRKSMQFPEAKVNGPQSCASVLPPVAMVTNAFKKRTNPTGIAGLPTLSSAVHSLDSPSDALSDVDLPNSLPGPSSGNWTANPQIKEEDVRFDHCAVEVHSTSPLLPAGKLPNEQVFPQSGLHSSRNDRKGTHHVNQVRKSNTGSDMANTSEMGISREEIPQAIYSRSSANSQAFSRQSPLKMKSPSGDHISIPMQESEAKPQWLASTDSPTKVQLCGNQFKKSSASSKSVTSQCGSGVRNVINSTQSLSSSQSLATSSTQHLNSSTSSKFKPSQVPTTFSSGHSFVSPAGISSGQCNSPNNRKGTHGSVSSSRAGISTEIIDGHRPSSNIQALTQQSNEKLKSQGENVLNSIAEESEAVPQWAPSTNLSSNVSLCVDQVGKSNTSDMPSLSKTEISRELTPQASYSRPSANSQVFSQQSLIKMESPNGDDMPTHMQQKSEAITASTMSPTKVQLCGNQFKKSNTSDKSVTSQCRREEITVTNSTQSTSSAQSLATSSTQHVNSSTSFTFKQAQVPTPSFSSRSSGISPARKLSPGNNSSRFQRYGRPQSCPAKAPSPLRQMSLTDYFGVKPPPESINIPETSPAKVAFPKKSARKSLNEVWSNEAKNSDLSNKEESKECSQGPRQSLLVSAANVCSKKHHDNKQLESRVSVPPSSGDSCLASSLEAFENEDIFEDLEITDEGTVIHSQSSQEKSMEEEDLLVSEETSKECGKQVDKNSECSLLSNDNDGSEYCGVRSSPAIVTTPETSPAKVPFPKKSVRKSLNEVWSNKAKNSDLPNKEESKESSQLLRKSLLVSAKNVCSKKHHDDKQQESHISVPPSSGEASLASSLEAFENEDTFDNLEITDEGTVIHSQPSQEKNMATEDLSISGETSKECGKQVDKNSESLSNDDGCDDSDDEDDGAWIEDMIERDDASKPLKSRTYGLVGDGVGEEEEEVNKNQDHFAKLPPEIIEDIFSRISVIDLLRNCSLVCRRWRNIISSESFMTWKKSYMKCKRKEGQWQSPLAASSEESCLLDVIRYLASVKRTPGDSTPADLEKHSRYTFAKDLIAENLPELITNERPHPWSVVAAIVILAETVSDVREVLTCLSRPGSTNGTTTVTEVLYCVATLLLSLQRKYNLCRRLHFRVFYALFLFENDARPSSILVKDSTPEVQWRKAKAGNLKYPLTQEQLRVVNHHLRGRQNEVVKVIAFAGTGKTTTLIKFAEANRYLRLLYVAFNKTVQLEATRTFPGNTECRTTHSLAFQKLKHRYGKKLTYALKPYIVRELLQQKSNPEKSKLHWAVYGRLVANSVNCFMSSSDEFITTRHVPESYTTASKPRTMLLHEDRMAILRDAEYLWERMIDENDKRARITHDGYLKVYQLSKPIISDVDCLLIDEAQDLTAAQEDILLNQPIPKILVGDPHQQIYSFRGARNCMNNIPANTVYHLTQSFRFGSEIAYMANCILDVLKGMTDQTIVGKEEEGSLCGQQIGQKAIICRGNIMIFKEAVRLTSMENRSHRRIGFTGDLKFEKLMELYKMSTGSCNVISDDFFRKMQTFHNLEVYARNADDVELLGMISIVKMYCHRLPELIETIKEDVVNNLQHATIVLTTAHKAKGLEFDTVQLADDFAIFSPSFTPIEGEVMITESVNLSDDEKNLIYVAVTRAKKSLLLNENLKKCLGKTSDHFKFPLSTKLFLEGEHTNSQCLDCGHAIASLERVTMAKVWAVETAKVGGSLYHPHPTTKGGYICSRCAYHHLPGFQKIFLGDKKPPTAAQIE